MELAQDVLTYYFTHAGVLSPEKRFHLGARLAAWNRDPRALELLRASKAWLVPKPVNDETLTAAFEQAAGIAVRHAEHMVAYDRRKLYFDRYPGILGLEAELFRLRHLQVFYNVDARPVFLRRYPLTELEELERSLLDDPEAVRALSSWAVNFLYLLRRFVLQDESGIDIAQLYAIGEGYDTADEEQLRLLSYLYTHCVIAESNFYAREVPKQTLPVYRKMLERLETICERRLDGMSLDTKLEFLVSCELIGYKTKLRGAIHKECAQSVSPEGMFIVDTHNTFSQKQAKKTFEASEHRNVLFAMSWLPHVVG